MSEVNETLQRELAHVFGRLEAIHEAGRIRAICINVVYDDGKTEQLVAVPPVNGIALCLIGAVQCSSHMLVCYVTENGSEGSLQR